jgi:uncharacterized damage-inducible protein DinB
MTGRPGTNEYADYFEKYVSLVPDGDIAETLARQIDESLATYRSISEEQSRFRYAAGKWTIKQALGHVCDAERVFSYRAVAFARGDGNPLPSFDQDKWMPFADSDSRTWRSLLEELKAIRASTVALFRSLTDEALSRRGVASGKEVSVLALGFITAGHERHHLTVLKTKYLAAPDFPGH